MGRWWIECWVRLVRLLEGARVVSKVEGLDGCVGRFPTISVKMRRSWRKRIVRVWRPWSTKTRRRGKGVEVDIEVMVHDMEDKKESWRS